MAKRRKYQDSDQFLPEASLPPVAPSSRPHQAETQPKKGSKLPFSFLSWPIRAAGSLTVGIILMIVLAALLAWGTLIEKDYGREVASFLLYGSHWFVFIQGLLALNLALAMLLRLPWRRRHLPFLLAHFGIILLLTGSLLTWTRGHEAQISIPEGLATTRALTTSRMHFDLDTISHDRAASNKNGIAKIPFEGGPFNWDDYDSQNWFGRDRQQSSQIMWLAMQWGNRHRGTVMESDGIKLEVLDYLVSSTLQSVPPLEMSLLWKTPITTQTELGETKTIPRNWERIKMEIKPREHVRQFTVRGTQTELSGGERVCYYMTTLNAEVQAFLNVNDHAASDESSPTGSWGQVILYYSGKNIAIDVDTLLRSTEGGNRIPLEGTPFQLGVVHFRPRGPLLHLVVSTSGGEEEFLTLHPDLPETNVHARGFGIFGTYLVDPTRLSRSHADQISPTILARLKRPRLELLQGPDKQLYYRYWTGRTISSTGRFDQPKEVSDGKKPQLSLDPNTESAVEVVLERFVAQDQPGMRVVATPVGVDQGSERRAKIRLTVDGNEDEFWIRAMYPSVIPLAPQADQVRFIYGRGRTIRFVWDYDTVDLGFGIFLKQFDKRSEPGTRMSGYYSSLIDFVDMTGLNGIQRGFTRSSDDFRVIKEDVTIKMNQPAVFQGRTRKYRIYQSAYEGPFHPDDYRFQELYDGSVFPWEKKPRESLYMSKLTVNDDPGRGLKYLGGFMIILGIGWYCIGRSSKRTMPEKE